MFALRKLRYFCDPVDPPNAEPALPPSERRQSFKRATLPAAVVALVTALLIGRMFYYIDRYAVDILVSDQWGFSTPVFLHADPITLFRWQHGPHREGLGLWITAIVVYLTGWNTRAECFVIGAIVAVSCLVMLWLRRRLWGPLAYSDVALPVLFLSLAQWETFVGIPHIAYGPLPVLLLLLTCAAWLIPRLRYRYPAVCVLVFCATFTGMGLFLGFLAPLFFLVEMKHARRDRRALLAATLGLACSLLTIVAFLAGYTGRLGAAPHYSWQPGFYQYIKFMAVMLSTIFDIETLRRAVQIGFWLLLVLAAIAAYHGWRYLRDDGAPNRTIALLALFTLLYCASTAYGRTGIGPMYAYASRYVTLVIPGLAALYLYGLGLPGRDRRIWTYGMAILVVLFVGPVAQRDVDFMEQQYQQKTAWRDAYKRTGDVHAADGMAHFRLSLDTQSTLMNEKLAYFRQHRLNLFQSH